MAAIPLNPAIASQIVADWRTGEYSIRDLADQHKVSRGKVGELCKGVHKDMVDIVDAGIAFRQGLSEQDGQIVDAVVAVVDKRTKDLEFYNSAQRLVSKVAMLGIKQMIGKDGKPNDNFSMAAVNQASSAISTSRMGELGKSPDTVINNTNAQQAIVELRPQLTRDEWLAAMLPQ